MTTRFGTIGSTKVDREADQDQSEELLRSTPAIRPSAAAAGYFPRQAQSDVGQPESDRQREQRESEERTWLRSTISSSPSTIGPMHGAATSRYRADQQRAGVAGSRRPPSP